MLVMEPTKKKRGKSFVCKNMDRDSIMLSEISESEQHKYHMISLIRGLEKQTGAPGKFSKLSV